MDTIQVTTPTGRKLRVRLSALLRVDTRFDTWADRRSAANRRFFLRYRSGRCLEVDHDSATAVFDALSPKLFETM